ncbi:hypothetical protein BT93_G0168 [Corymbia citriodora subsp. variegata]|nr:hypothetical protein BT93_G0168 [Corymbia citriodora subsp. variegata]
MELLELEANDIRVVGIHGRDGIGKTTLAKIIYEQICLRFDACSFLAEIEQTTQQAGGVRYLQTKLIFDILKKEYEVASAFKGVRYLKEIFRKIKVLIVLDDVERESLLKDFVGAKLDWFGPGSRIIVTSKEGRVFQDFVAQGLAHIYDVIPMDVNLAFNILWQHTTEKCVELRSYVKIAIEIVKAAKRLPLLLKVFGYFLHGKGLKDWVNFEDIIQQFQEDPQKILRIIYDALDQKQKQIYLDIACFPPDVDYGIASYMWHQSVYPYYELRYLHLRCLITVEKDKIGMHSMLRCLARKIIREGFHDPGTGVGCLARKIIREGFHDPGTGVGLYLPAKAQDTNQGKKGTDHLNTEEAGFEIPPNTTFLSLGDANIGGHFAGALMNVRWLHWQGCPRDAINIHLEKNENLVVLDLSWSKVTESWEGWKRIKMQRLKVLNLTGCVDLLVTPSFSRCPNLEILILERCSRLVHLDPSINDLKLLVTLNLKFCFELSMLPVEMAGMNALKKLLIDGTSIRELPESIGKLVRLQILSATNCFSLARVPGSVCGLEDLLMLAMDDGKFLELPESLGNLRVLRRLSLRSCRGLGKLPEFNSHWLPESFVYWGAELELGYQLEELDISGTGISRLPESIKNLKNLKVLKMDSCFLREFPGYIGELINLEEIHASWCRSLEGVIPSDICKLGHLKQLRLRGSRISCIPPIDKMIGLQTLDLLHCDLLQELPMLCPGDLSNLYVNPGLKQKMVEDSEYKSWWHLLQ